MANSSWPSPASVRRSVLHPSNARLKCSLALATSASFAIRLSSVRFARFEGATTASSSSSSSPSISSPSSSSSGSVLA
eukprot:819732-Prymnesium_polylepis.1